MQNRMSDQQEIRAAAVQAAVLYVNKDGGSLKDVMNVANRLASFISRGQELVPEEPTLRTDPSGQFMARMVLRVHSSEEIDFLHRVAAEMSCLDTIVPIGDGYGSLEELMNRVRRNL